MVYSGAALHIVNKSLLTKKELRTVRRVPGLTHQTVNGQVCADKVVDVYVENLNITLEALIVVT